MTYQEAQQLALLFGKQAKQARSVTHARYHARMAAHYALRALRMKGY